MSATTPRPEDEATLETATRPVRPPLGHFIIERSKKLILTECPICALDPSRERHVFEPYANRQAHFLLDHDADDIGRPMAELLPEPDDEVVAGGDA